MGYTALHASCNKRNLAVIKLLIEHGSDYAILTYKGESIYDFMAENGTTRDYVNALTKIPFFISRRLRKVEQYIQNTIQYAPDGKYSELENLQEHFMKLDT